ncbi:hypothetical protein CEP54_012485 [Fusarium duplospermum]|uniref:Uncharacterized protein n=1 Tax=Fusarium duplospermum TaxID=1325734 RepID=A0A428P8R8_9HYPO|nr:hypothetical protein CEP54_012485 [Fusarium duplospermum]
MAKRRGTYSRNLGMPCLKRIRATCEHRTLVTTVVKTFSNLLNSTHHPFAGARCSADSGGSADSTFEQ